MTSIRSYADAEKYLAGGRAKTYRPISANTYLARVNDTSIALVVHETAVVTYHENTTMTIFSGYWWTQLTSQKIKEYSPLNPWSNKGDGFIQRHEKASG